MQLRAATQNMGLLVIVSLLLIVGGGGGRIHVNFADAAKTTPKPETLITYWEAVLPEVPVPPAIIDLLAQQNGLGSVNGVTMSPNNLKFVEGLRKIGPKYEKAPKSDSDHGDKHVHIAPKAEDDLKEISMTYGSQAHKPEMEGNLKEVSVSYGLVGERDIRKVETNLKKILAAYRPRKQENLKEVSISYGSKGGEDLKEVSVSYGLEGEKDLKEISMSYGLEGEKDLKEISKSYGVEGSEGVKEISMSYGVEGSEVVKEISMSYGLEKNKNSNEVKGLTEQEGNLKEISVLYGLAEGKDGHNEVVHQGEEDPNKATMSYGSEEEEDPNKATMSYGSEQEEDTHKVTMSYQSEVEEDPNKATMSYGSEEEEDQNKATMSYGSEQEEDTHKVTMSYQSEVEEDPNKATMSYGSEEEEDQNKATMSYGSEQEEDTQKVTMSYQSEVEEDPNKATISYRSEEEEDQNKATMSYGSEHEDPQKVTMSYGSQHEDDKKTLSIGHEAHIADKGRHHHHAHAYSHNSNKRHQADVFFFHDMLRPGSIITPTIPPTTSLPALLPRRVADSIPFSTRRLSDIVAMFTPASLQMTREIRWTLDTCEHPRTLPGQSAGCATSLESLAELPTSLLGTSNVRAFSAANLPLEAPGTRALRGRYNVTAVRKVSGDSSAIVTCHDLTHPYAVYYCHTANPTAAYSVTLTSVEDATVAPSTMEALAVCHLDTSKWSPKNPFFELHNLKPGEVTVCHFLTKLSIIWVPGGEQGDAHVAAW